MRRVAIIGLAVLAAALLGSGCKHVIRVPGGDIRIGEESRPVGPILTAEDASGDPCGPGLPDCSGGTACFATDGGAICMTEEAACESAGCAGRPCQIAESFPMRAICH